MRTRAAIALLALGLAGSARAALGEPESSLAADRKALSAVKGATIPGSAYSVEELVSHGNVVREYVSGAGVVFAIAWRGLSPPDLGPLLGGYASEYRQAARRAAGRPGHRYRKLETPHLVVESFGHMRDLGGRAYAPSLFPPGVTPDEIR